MIKIIKDSNIGGAYHTAFLIEMRKQYTILIGKSSEQKHTVSPTFTTDNNVQIGLTGYLNYFGLDLVSTAFYKQYQGFV
jgi:hypothetical protein